jgi:uncharacterized membrane protein
MPPRKKPKNRRTLPSLAQKNLRTVAQIERHYLQNRTHGERVGDAVAQFSGSIPFFVLNGLWYLAWIVVNTGHVPGIKPFDPYPFTFLTLMVSLEAIFLSIFVLASQNRMSRVADYRANLDLEINMLAEEESTQTLRLLTSIAKKLGLETETRDPDMRELTQRTNAKRLLEELEKRLHNQSP